METEKRDRMSKKQFEYYETNVVGHITKGLKIIDEFDNEKYISSVREIVWLLKELNAENEQLKYHLTRTEKELQEYKDFMSLG